MNISYLSYDAATVAGLRAGGPDAYGNAAEIMTSSGEGNPCRCCLDHVPLGAEMLVCAARPFDGLHAYAETGPIFLCADVCAPYAGDTPPPILRSSPDYLVKAYDMDERIVYGTGRITAAADVPAYAASLLARDGIAHVDIRSAKNNCFLTRVIRTDGQHNHRPSQTGT